MNKPWSLMSKRTFIEEYSVKIPRPFEIAYTLPAGISVIQMLHEAQELSLKIHGIVAVYPYRLSQWSQNAAFNKQHRINKHIVLHTAIKHSEFKTRREQERLLKSKGLAQVTAPFLAGAHAAFFVMKRADFFDGSIIRCKGSKLYYGDGGLSEMDEGDYINQCRYKNVKMAALLMD